jgi:hypothetical protein
MKASLLVPKDGNSGGTTRVFWARSASNQGYMLEFKRHPTLANEIDVNVYRNGTRIVALTSSTVSTATMTAVNADTSSFDIRSESFIDTYGLFDVLDTTGPEYELWIDIDLSHDLETYSVLNVTYTFEIYEIGVNGGKLNNEPVLSSKEKFLRVSEGYSGIPTIGFPTEYGFNATSTSFPAIIADLELSTRQVEISPTDENLTLKKTKIYTRGPVRYMAWVTTPLDTESQWGAFSTGDQGTYSTRYDPLDSAQLLINGKPRTEMEDARYYTVYHPLQKIHRALPAGIHLYAFGGDPTVFEPDASMNFSRAGDVTLYQRYKKWNPSATSLGDLRVSESLPIARDYKRIRIYLVGYNVLVIKDGTMALERV